MRSERKVKSSLRKHAYSNILKILPQKKKKKKRENFQIKILIFFRLVLKT